MAGGGLFTNGATVSAWAPDSFVAVSGGRLGGTGRIETHGDVTFSNGTVLTSINAAGGTSYGGSNGNLRIMSDGEMRVDDGLALYTRYRIDVDGSVTLINDTSFMTGDWGTATDILPTGRFTIDGDGGY